MTCVENTRGQVDLLHLDMKHVYSPSGPPVYLAQYGVFIVELIRTSQGEEKLATVIIWPSIRHGNQSSPIKAQSGVKLILKEKTNRYSLNVRLVDCMCHQDRRFARRPNRDYLLFW